MRSLPEIKAKIPELDASSVWKGVCNKKVWAALFLVIISEVLAVQVGLLSAIMVEVGERLLKETENATIQMTSSNCHYSWL